jgi:hypothetical protein
MTNTVRSTALAAAFYLITASLLVVGLPLQAPAAGCADPAPPPDGNGKVTGADALYCLQMAVGSQPVDLTTCDADDGGTATASDALRVLRVAVGQDVPLTCPGPPTTSTTSTTGSTSTTSSTLGAPALTWTQIAAMFQTDQSVCSDSGLPCNLSPECNTATCIDQRVCGDSGLSCDEDADCTPATCIDQRVCSDSGLPCAEDAECKGNTCLATGGCLGSRCHVTSLTEDCPSCCNYPLFPTADCPLITYSDMVDVASKEIPTRLLIEPGNAQASWLMDKLKGRPWVTDSPEICTLAQGAVFRCSDTAADCTTSSNCTTPGATCESWCGLAMPGSSSTEYFTGEELAGIRSWINSGAPNN